jgi:hypothetical protein
MDVRGAATLLLWHLQQQAAGAGVGVTAPWADLVNAPQQALGGTAAAGQGPEASSPHRPAAAAGPGPAAEEVPPAGPAPSSSWAGLLTNSLLQHWGLALPQQPQQAQQQQATGGADKRAATDDDPGSSGSVLIPMRFSAAGKPLPNSAAAVARGGSGGGVGSPLRRKVRVTARSSSAAAQGSGSRQQQQQQQVEGGAAAGNTGAGSSQGQQQALPGTSGGGGGPALAGVAPAAAAPPAADEAGPGHSAVPISPLMAAAAGAGSAPGAVGSSSSTAAAGSGPLQHTTHSSAAATALPAQEAGGTGAGEHCADNTTASIPGVAAVPAGARGGSVQQDSGAGGASGVDPPAHPQPAAGQPSRAPETLLPQPQDAIAALHLLQQQLVQVLQLLGAGGQASPQAAADLLSGCSMGQLLAAVQGAGGSSSGAVPVLGVPSNGSSILYHQEGLGLGWAAGNSSLTSLALPAWLPPADFEALGGSAAGSSTQPQAQQQVQQQRSPALLLVGPCTTSTPAATSSSSGDTLAGVADLASQQGPSTVSTQPPPPQQQQQQPYARAQQPVASLLGASADGGDPGGVGLKPLHVAAATGRLDVVERMLQVGCRPNKALRVLHPPFDLLARSPAAPGSRSSSSSSSGGSGSSSGSSGSGERETLTSGDDVDYQAVYEHGADLLSRPIWEVAGRAVEAAVAAAKAGVICAAAVKGGGDPGTSDATTNTAPSSSSSSGKDTQVAAQDSGPQGPEPRQADAAGLSSGRRCNGRAPLLPPNSVAGWQVAAQAPAGWGATALHLAACHGHVAIVEALLRYATLDPQCTTAEGLTALHVAAHVGQAGEVKLNGCWRVAGGLLGGGCWRDVLGSNRVCWGGDRRDVLGECAGGMCWRGAEGVLLEGCCWGVTGGMLDHF